MVLGIKLEIDKGSVKSASKEIRDAAEKSIAKKEQSKKIALEEKRIRKEKGIEEPGDKKKGGVGRAAAVGGFLGALIGSLKPVQELLGVIAGIMQIFMVPIFILLKPFILMFLKVGQALLKFFGPTEGEGGTTGKLKTGAGILLGVFAAIAAFLLGASIGWIVAIGLIFFFLGRKLFEFGMWLGEKLLQFVNWLWNNILLPAGQWIGEKLRQIGEFFLAAWDFIKEVAQTIWGWIKSGFMAVVNFGKRIWELFKTGLMAVANFGNDIWELFKSGLSAIANLGSMIWNWITSALGGLFGSGRSVDDALITSQGQIINLNPKDNVLAFQDFSQVENMTNQNGGARGGNTYITVEGFVGDEDTLADKISKALSDSSRGGITNFN